MEIEEALKKIIAHLKPTEEVMPCPLADAMGAVLAEDLIAQRNVPDFPRSAMDGYAVHSEDVADASKANPVTLQIQGELCAGDVPDPALEYGPGTAVRIMTGACVPAPYDAVVMQEHTNLGMDQVEIYDSVRAFQNYCRPGEELEQGTVVVQAGTRLQAPHLALIAELGRARVKVYAPARVALISTGSELQEAGEEAQPGKIYNSISYMLQGAIRQQGLQVLSRQLCPDQEDTLAEMLRQALEQADVVITTGGVSVGKRDIVCKVLEEMGGEFLFQRVDIQPGTPTAGYAFGNKIVLALSGNPYAALANFEIYFWDMMAEFMHCQQFRPVRRMAILQSEYPKVNHHRRLLRALYENGEVRLPEGVHASSVISNLTACNCLIDLEAGRAVEKGDWVRVQMFSYL